MRFQLGDALGMTSAICTNRFSQNKSSVFKVVVTIFSKDLFLDYLGPVCGKHARLLFTPRMGAVYIFVAVFFE